MKKFTLGLFAVVLSMGHGYSQANLSVVAPPPNGASTQLRAPNGTAGQAAMRGCFIIPASELTGLSASPVISTFGFILDTANASVPVTGNFTLYLQNTANTTYTMGTNWTTIVPSMQNVFAGSMTIPVSNSSTTINFTLPSGFNYTGGGLYVAYDWTSAGPFDARGSTYRANNSIAIGGATADNTAPPAPTTLANSAFRPCFNFGAVNTATNEVQVINVMAPGKVAYLLNSPHTVTSLIKNGSNTVLNNISVNLNVTGANTFASNIVISSLAAGASTNISFAPFNPQTPGLNTLSVSVAPDQNNTNNSATWSQSVTCNITGVDPQLVTYTAGVGFNTGSGIITNKVIPPVSASLSAVRIAISNDAAAVGKQIYGVLLNSAGVIMATTNTITITAAMAGAFQHLVYTSSQPVTAGNSYFAGLAQPSVATGYFPLGSYSVVTLPAGLYFTSPLAGGSVNALATNLGYFGIEPVYSFTNLAISATQSSTLSCKGQSVTLTASGLNSYTWTSPASSATSVVVSPTVTTSYTVIGTNGGGCTNLTVLTHSVDNPVITGATNKASICPGLSATLTANGAVAYTWANSALTTSAIVVSPTATTVYTVTGTSVNGCTSNVVSITQNVAACTGILVNNLANADIKVFPNPSVNGLSTISGMSGASTILIYNVIGQVVATKHTEEETVSIDLSGEPNGAYFIKISNAANGSKTVKIVNQN